MNHRLPMIGTLTLALLQSLEATGADYDPSQWFLLSRGKDLAWPAGLKVQLVSNRTEFFLGESVLLHYRIENTGADTVRISTGGDYRGSTRPDRFVVTAVSETGMTVDDPTPLMRNFGGGLMPRGDIQPGGEWFEDVAVQEYCRFDAPGTYTIRAFHDLGYGPQRTNDPRNAELTIKLRAPSEADARGILEENEKASSYSGRSAGKKGESRLDYPCIRWPTFLRPLQERAQGGDEQALKGLASIRTADASRALLALLDHTNVAFAAKAAALIEPRLPHPESAFAGPWGAQRRQFVITNAWSEALSKDVRAYCVRVLAGTEREDFLTASKLLSLVGTTGEISSLRLALEVAVAGTNAAYQFEIHYPAPIRAADALLGAALVIHSNLDVAASETLSPGDVLLFIARHGGGDKTLSAEEEAVFARALQHPLPYVRMKALEGLPQTFSPAISGLVLARMTDAYEGVQTYAFETARRMNDPRHRDAALGVLKTARNEWLLRAAHDIAIKNDARYEAATLWAGRIAPPKDMNDYFPHEVIRHLFDLVVGGNVGANLETPKDADSARTMREQWLAFLEKQRAAISEGGHFKIADLPEGLGVRASSTGGVGVSPQR